MSSKGSAFTKKTLQWYEVKAGKLQILKTILANMADQASQFSSPLGMGGCLNETHLTPSHSQNTNK